MIVVPAETLLDAAMGQGMGLAKKIALKTADADQVKKLSGPEALLLFAEAIQLHERAMHPKSKVKRMAAVSACFSPSRSPSDEWGASTWRSGSASCPSQSTALWIDQVSRTSASLLTAVVEGGGVFGQRQIKICGIDMRFIPVDQRDIVSENADVAAIVRVAVNNTCVDQ